jgi:hypothetical protein
MNDLRLIRWLNTTATVGEAERLCGRKRAGRRIPRQVVAARLGEHGVAEEFFPRRPAREKDGLDLLAGEFRRENELHATAP